MKSPLLKDLLEGCKGRSEKVFNAGDEIIKEGQKHDQLFILSSGKVEVVKEGIQIAVVDQVGAVFGEISALLKTPHNATVKALTECKFYVIPEASRYLEQNPRVTLAIARILAQRLFAIDEKFADLKKKLTIV